MHIRSLLASLTALTLAACGQSECKLDDPSACSGGAVCESVNGLTTGRCFQPVQLQGRVFDISTAAALSGATVSALDVNGAPAGDVVTSGSDGTYVLRIPSPRADETGKPVARSVLLRAAAEDYVPFPSGLRISLPIDTGPAKQADAKGPWVLSSPLTEVGLSPVPAGEAGRSRITGTVELSAGQRSVLVAVEANGKAITALADGKGNFTLYNVPSGSYTVRAYSRGTAYAPANNVSVETGKDTTGVALKKSAQQKLATVSGKVSLVAGAGQNKTSVVLVLESTYNEALQRGEVPPGLRAPDPGTSPNLDGDWAIDGVPDGKYVALAAFENDNLVRDPDPTISGTQVQHLTVTDGANVSLSSFKVTAAVVMVGPGASGDAPEETTATPTFTWKPYSSAKTFSLKVFDALGNEVWGASTITATTSSDIAVTYAGPALAAGQIYQWRATARDNTLAAISQTEELRGVFRVK